MPIDFLLKLHRGQFPVTITSGPELKYVSLLKATGLIEACLAVSGPGDRSFRRIDAALVYSITEAGMSELQVAIGRKVEAQPTFIEGNTLAIEFLRLLANSDLPVTVTESRMIVCVEILSNAGLLAADVDPIHFDMREARAQKITAVGYDFLSRGNGKADGLARRRSPQMVENWIAALPVLNEQSSQSSQSSQL